ncbi:nuclear transport factor 2 family protein [Halomonas sp. HP20-15]|uniref:nuclear transport factor 2 family protein n=1 Tax=Halomonas sp. HP20-15 TaxID=3085901 RepID=UPI0029810870|nr:nuclear transport factor 2 family protein [Halomonas sp. HP20-15]MDW5376152.1 nuclear transport factor 2 family protein [Halomonas sp. HP20-15]
MAVDPPLEAFCAFYNKLDKSCTKHLPEIYTADIRFIDPFQRIEGIAALTGYFDSLYANLESAHFEFAQRQRQGDQAFVCWTLTLVHPRLAGGRRVAIEGCSRLRFRGDRVCEHHDYFDAGALLYEHLPLLGTAIRWLKRRLA